MADYTAEELTAFSGSITAVATVVLAGAAIVIAVIEKRRSDRESERLQEERARVEAAEIREQFLRVSTRVQRSERVFDVTVINVGNWTWRDVRVLYVHEEMTPGADPHDRSTFDWVERELGIDGTALVVLGESRHLSQVLIANTLNPGDGPITEMIERPISASITAIDRYGNRQTRVVDDWK